ncbi:IucA/IucC family siderophore biosynthesis protein [Actinobacteria bacterium YIM 96077]|uniref:IucA/IucC family siderophore biosynthesis protein n=1 Tax=Phytoactinopolyspora halophila TaxID=1981511 RepID=A0A329QNS8_9ACTN|nr:IucA/IucC family protein [Phytoactinopolyspora halophila]AYY14608.1 IucA/IucC family siderophore biosynthesis protein [Actinobacteria bacterium YIM 96077]RAW14015.1 IucA/IucC family siderophore biosynthesis protein [Phytoactinopolyspora halophila]
MRHAAEHASIRALLNCWIRETPRWSLETRPDEGTVLTVPLPRWNAHIEAPVSRVSATFRHELALPAWLIVAGQQARPVTLATLATLLADELDGTVSGSDGAGGSDSADGGGEPDSADEPDGGNALLRRILDSSAAISGHLHARAGEIDRLWSADPLPFGASEQALLLGHMCHPTPKSRGEMTETQRQLYSPELAGRFPLRWLAVEPDLVRHASATGTPAPELAKQLLRTDPSTDVAALDAMTGAVGERIILPAHPFEADRLAADPATAHLFATEAVVDLGTFGSPYLPTTSVRTVYRPDAAWQLKFSLHVRVTNSMRVTLPKELDRAVESAMLARTSLGEQVAALAPHFTLLQDPAYLTVTSGGDVQDGFSVLLRENRWTRDGPGDVSALTTLCQDHPAGGDSRLIAIVDAIARRERRSASDVAREWFARYGDVVIRSLIRLYLDAGLCVEAHQQNTLVELDRGWPVHGVYRDSQGYFHREAAHDDVTRLLPGLGEATESIFPESLADERLAYYMFVNAALGVINALGPRVGEEVLLADLRDLLIGERKRGGRYPATLLDRLLDDAQWPCKANLLTRVNGMDELVGDISQQSVYVTLPNPLRESP